MEKDNLPKICAAHDFIPRDGITVTEDVVLLSAAGNDAPEKGDICQICFQISGTDDGDRDTSLVKAFKARASWPKEQADWERRMKARQLALAAMGFPDAK